jgi:hypothetical protein
VVNLCSLWKRGEQDTFSLYKSLLAFRQIEEGQRALLYPFLLNCLQLNNPSYFREAYSGFPQGKDPDLDHLLISAVKRLPVWSVSGYKCFNNLLAKFIQHTIISLPKLFLPASVS